jgi:MFS family permease
MRELFKLRNFRVYFFGSTVDTIGDMAFWLAAAIWIKELTGSTAQAGLGILFLNAGTLLSPVTGILVDRLPRKRTLMTANALTALILLSLATVHRANQVWLIYLVMFLYGVSAAITNSAFNGLKEQLMPKELFGHGSGLSQTVQQGVRLITPALGLGILAAFGGPALAIMDAATFAVGLACWASIRIDDRRPPRPEAGASWWQESTAGFTYLFRTPVLRQLTISLAVACFGMGFLETLGIAVSTVGLHHSPTWVGVLVTVMGVTGIVGGLTAGTLMARLGPGFLTALGLVICGLGCLALAVPNVYVVLAAAVATGLGLPFAIVGSVSAVQLFTPNELMGRVGGVDNLIVSGLQVLGIGAGAALISAVFYRDLCYLVAGTMIVSALYIFTRKAQRKSNLPQPTATPDAATLPAAADPDAAEAADAPAPVGGSSGEASPGAAEPQLA